MNIRWPWLFVAVLTPAHVFAQHDLGRNAVRLVAEGKVEAGVALVQKGPRRSNSPISDAERAFVLTMAACKQGDLTAALAHAKAAVEQGLPVERLQAGPPFALCEAV